MVSLPVFAHRAHKVQTAIAYKHSYSVKRYVKRFRGQLWQTDSPPFQPAAGVRRAVFLSGMSGEEVSEVIGAYNDSG